MDISPSSFEAMLASNTSSDANFLRFCLSDQLPVNLTTVVTGDITPVAYATLVVRNHYTTVHDLLFAPDHDGPTKVTPKPIIARQWVFDRLVMVGMIYRAAMLRATSFHDAHEYAANAYPALLYLDTAHHQTALSGLCDYGRMVKLFLAVNRDNLVSPHMGLIARLGHAIGNADDPHWFLHKPAWISTLVHHHDRAGTLRRFLHLALSAQCIPDDHLFRMFETTRDQLDCHVEQLIDLLESVHADKVETVAFLRSIEEDVSDLPYNMNTYSLAWGDFASAKGYHRHSFGTRYDPAVSIATDQHDHPAWAQLRALGPDYAPERVLTGHLVPEDYICKVITDHPDTAWTIAAHELCSSAEDGSLPVTTEQHPPVYWITTNKWVRAIIYDTLHRLVVWRRYTEHTEHDPVRAGQRLCEVDHIQLVTRPMKHNCGHRPVFGLWQAATVLRRRLWSYHQRLTDQERTTMDQLIAALADLRCGAPQRMSKRWKRVFRHQDTADRLRYFLFIFIESLAIPDSPRYQAALGLDRPTMFGYVRHITHCLRSKPNAKALQRCLEQAPAFNDGYYPPVATPYDYMLWYAPFDAVLDFVASQRGDVSANPHH